MPFDAEPAVQPTSNEAAGIVYSEDAKAPGLKFFRCQPYGVTLSMKGCAKRWTEAQDVRGLWALPFTRCIACATGAAHAGKGQVTYSRWYRSGICPRCGVGGRRMIGNRLCISDYNRSREIKIGKNGRGNAPVELLQNPPRTVVVLVEVDGEARRLRDRNSSGMIETVIQFLRTNTGDNAFGFAGVGTRPTEAVVEAAEHADPADYRRRGLGGLSAHAGAPDAWLVTDRRCDACSGRVLVNAEWEFVHRCANCGSDDEGWIEEGAVIEAVNEEPADEQSELSRYRAWMFDGSALGRVHRHAWARAR